MRTRHRRGQVKKRGFSFVLGLILLVLAHPFTARADDAEPEPKKRVSFAISGGASKGAYEAGLNWAIVYLMRYVEEREDAALRGTFRSFDAVSMAGASAGGINTLLSAIAWCSRPEAEGGVPNRIEDNVFRNLWLTPDINSLLPPDADSPTYRPDDAVLARKSLVEAAQELRVIWNSPKFRKGCRVPLGVTVTSVNPEALDLGDIRVRNQRFTIPFEFRVQADSSAGFYFDPRDYPLLLDHSMLLLPNVPDAEQYKIHDDRVEEAVLTSSAFPMAFGRKRLQYCRMKASYAQQGKPVAAAQETQPSSLCPEGYQLSEGEFSDGGLFDNLPIGLARTLAEENKRSRKNPLPVTYIYLDPNRLRYPVPEQRQFEACYADNPPPACREMEHSLNAEGGLLFDALGTGQTYELYSELTGDAWAHNLSNIAYQAADLFEGLEKKLSCDQQLPFFSQELPCHSALRYAGKLLEVAYSRIDAPITPPFAVKKLQSAALVSDCRTPQAGKEAPMETECRIDFMKYRKELAQRLQAILELVPEQNAILLRRVRNAETSIHNDRIIRVTSRGAPITGELFGAFAAFLDRKFREYDYYVGVYDAVVRISDNVCEHHYSAKEQPQEYRNCRDAATKRMHGQLGIDKDPRANYVFALMANLEFGSQNAMQFAYDPLPAEDRDMTIIYQGLMNTQTAQWKRAANIAGVNSGEVEFFSYLKSQGFQPTPNPDGSAPLLADIMDDPQLWSYELTRRFTDRLVVLEDEAQRIYAEREPDPEKRPESSALIGGTAFVLRSSTYKYPDFDFAPSTAPADWKWRYVIPYEVAFDLVDGFIQVAWQPTWSLSKNDLLGARGSIAFAEGLFGDQAQDSQSNYFTLGVDYTRLTGYQMLSSFGVTPGYYRSFQTPETGSAGSWGGEVHAGVLQNKLRLALGARDFDDSGENWYLLLGLTDIPGIVYWFSR